MLSEWKCPKCGAKAHEHGPGRRDKCQYNQGGKDCEGLICECDDGSCDADDDHGMICTNTCKNANCYCCGWGGELPVPPKKMQPWEKKAFEAGWTPPPGRVLA